MSVRQSILRYIHVLNKLRKAPASYQEIDQYLILQSNLQDEKFNASKRQFQRDLKDISSIFELEIFYDASNGVYRINEDEISEISKRRMEAFDTFNALRIGENTSDLIHFENRKPLGTENLFGLIHAIKNRLNIKFSYQKFWEEKMTRRNVEPYALKEFKSRWYVLAKDYKDNNIKSFALDRLTSLEITNRSFIYPVNYDVEESYRYCFGIISPNGEEPQEIILSFDPVQGKYIKSLPLHHSQEILVDSEHELRIKLTLCITYDLVMELLSFGELMKVIEPASLIKEITKKYNKAIARYRNESH
ncbi:MAG TPA: WYL domain-containing protein [Prolixibacteraceae bacterium]|nr:WYL domain-containing protein [Prolixibacteraceae bacterium]